METTEKEKAKKKIALIRVHISASDQRIIIFGRFCNVKERVNAYSAVQQQTHTYISTCNAEHHYKRNVQNWWANE